MKTVRSQEVINVLKQLGISPVGVYKVEIELEKIIVYRYEVNSEGRKMLVPGTNQIAEEIEFVYIVP